MNLEPWPSTGHCTVVLVAAVRRATGGEQDHRVGRPSSPVARIPTRADAAGDRGRQGHFNLKQGR